MSAKAFARFVVASVLPLVAFVWAWFALTWQQALLFDMTELILGLALSDIWYATVKP